MIPIFLHVCVSLSWLGKYWRQEHFKMSVFIHNIFKTPYIIHFQSQIPTLDSSRAVSHRVTKDVSFKTQFVCLFVQSSVGIKMEVFMHTFPLSVCKYSFLFSILCHFLLADWVGRQYVVSFMEQRVVWNGSRDMHWGIFSGHRYSKLNAWTLK